MNKTLCTLALAALALGCGSGGADAVDAGTPPDVAIELAPSCTPFTPCGGDVEGAWTYSSGCVSDPFPELKVLCPSASYENLVVSAQGTLVFKGGEVVRRVTLSGSGVLKVPASCAGSSCSGLGANLSAVGVASTCTSVGGAGDCRCEITAGRTLAETGSYSLSGNTLVASGRSYEYCVAESALRQRETGSAPKEPGSYLLTRN